MVIIEALLSRPNTVVLRHEFDEAEGVVGLRSRDEIRGWVWTCGY
jgi:hypothetical protein